MSEEEDTFSITFNIVGPITRSTLETERPLDPKEQALEDLRTWIWGTREQVVRLQRALNAEWRPTSNEKVASRRRHRVWFDEHMLCVAAGQLQKSVDIARKFYPEIKLPQETARSLRLLRNIYEHWESERAFFQPSKSSNAKSARKLAKEFPTAEPWSIDLHPDGDVVLGHVVSLRFLSRQMAQLQDLVKKLRTS